MKFESTSTTSTQLGYKDHPYEGQPFLWNLRKRHSSGVFLTQLKSLPKMLLRFLKSLLLRRQLTSHTFLTFLLILGVFLTYLNITYLNDIIKESQGSKNSLQALRSTSSDPLKKKYAVHGKHVDSGYLKHVFETFDKLGYLRVGLEEEWDVLWAHDYPFRILKDRLSDPKKLKSSHKVNHFPGSGYITNKMNLATSDLPYVPKAFQLPKQKEELVKYAKNNPHKRFVEKSNNHRGIKIEKLEKLNLNSNSSFIQEYISNPLLIDGHKFDIGVYTILTSISPLRVYIYRDVLFRFCPETYHPFDPDIVDKYVVGDDYLPMWKVHSLSKYYNDLGFGMKDTFNSWFKQTKHKSPDIIWAQVESAIRTIYLKKEQNIIDTTKKYTGGLGRNFFEMVRFDFAIDDDGKVFIMEANMSPNLSSAHFPPNQLLYQQVLFNLFRLVGIANPVPSGRVTSDLIQVSPKHLAVFDSECFVEKCLYDCQNVRCALCHHCLNEETTEALRLAYLDQVNKGDCIRVFPPNSRFNYSVLKENKLEHETLMTFDTEGLSKVNQMEVEWFRGKCVIDESFC